MEVKVKEEGNIAAMGDQIVKLIAQEAKNTDQKIMLLKYLKEVVYNKETLGKKDEEKEPRTISAEERMALIEMVNKDLNNRKNNN